MANLSISLELNDLNTNIKSLISQLQTVPESSDFVRETNYNEQ